ncbi:GNAT family N-acetyltransferase [Kaistia terrae]|jgi:RimJ/RimL family protein N-acetyltransferase|uniref:GNAT family N-acetyltransferase n=1 Tax=Kaistia terrae TaxID=537017 RepID=A0ABW0PY43_9HYPH|nr:GNAT family N-acetyltransferase [Kaistia terrae]MCX5580962.1 GNAT family N-acetyltransferase [Kaistia terrae]
MRDQDLEGTLEDEERTVLTARLTLRRPRTEDAAILAAAIDNPRVAMNLVSVPHPYRRADADAWILQARHAVDGAAHVAASRTDGTLLGASFHRLSATRPEGHDLSFWVAERFWGEGFGTEIAHATIDHAFGAAGVERLWCAVRVTNGPARRVAEKCGFQFRDTGMVRSLSARGSVPVEHFVLERRVWQSLKSWGRRPDGDGASTTLWPRPLHEEGDR